jgi:DGQHR domain-containing protein
MSRPQPKTWTYRAILAQQSPKHACLMCSASVRDILVWAKIERIGRGGDGQLRGFQRPQIASHIREIRDYLAQPNAVLPTPIVVAFVGGVKVVHAGDGTATISITPEAGGLGFVVDGQQRLMALAGLPDKDFQVFVSVLVCSDHEELRRQFVLINSARPLPQSLVYELLPGVDRLPQRLSSRIQAAQLTERLNYDEASSLRHQIFLHTHPTGCIKDTAIQKVIMSSISDGALREVRGLEDEVELAFRLISDFCGAVQDVFPEDWRGHSPRTSRLVHGAGIVALGFVMELLYARDGARERSAFRRGLSVLKGRTAWTHGSWRFSDSEVVPWNAIQNVPRQILELAQHLVTVVKRSPAPQAV